MTINSLPQVLIIDDFLGGPDGVDFRQKFCAALSLRDAGRGPHPQSGAEECLAQVTFESAQEIDRVGTSINSETKAINAIKRGWPFENGSRWALVCLDLQFDVGPRGLRRAENFGVKLLNRIEEEFRIEDTTSFAASQCQIPIVMLSTHPPESVEKIVGPLSNVPFIQKWKDRSDAAETRARIEFGRVMFKESLAPDGTLRFVSKDGKVLAVSRERLILGSSYPLLNALRNARRILSKSRDARVLIMGEQGTGKELLVSYLHHHREAAKAYDRHASKDWKRGRLEVVHLKELPDTLFAAALKGTEKGFATQVFNNESAFEKAGTGTVHLDEIGNLSTENLQILLRLVENDKFQRIGGKVALPIRCQMTATTNKDIRRKVEIGEFPSDLFDRFDKLSLPPLRERKDDIETLFREFINNEVRKLDCRPKIIHGDVVGWIKWEYEWRGNVRQLQHAAENIVTHREYASNIYLRDVKTGVQLTGVELQRRWRGGFGDLIDALTNYRFDPEEVDGAWPKLKSALGSLLGNLIETAGKKCKLRAGKVNRVACVTLIKGLEVNGEKSDATECLRWLRFLHNELEADGDMVRQLITQAPKKTRK